MYVYIDVFYRYSGINTSVLVLKHGRTSITGFFYEGEGAVVMRDVNVGCGC